MVQLPLTMALGGCSASPLLHQPLPVSASYHRLQSSAGLRHVSLGGCCTPDHPEQHRLKLLLSREPEWVVNHLDHRRHLTRSAVPQTHQHGGKDGKSQWGRRAGAWNDHLSQSWHQGKHSVASHGHVCFCGPGIHFWETVVYNPKPKWQLWPHLNQAQPGLRVRPGFADSRVKPVSVIHCCGLTYLLSFWAILYASELFLEQQG